MLRSLYLIAVLFSLLVASPVLSQSVTPNNFADVLSGSKHPLSLKLKDLDGTWRSFSLGGSDNVSSIYVALLSGGIQNTYYTHGETEALGGEIYLVAYHPQLPPNPLTVLQVQGGFMHAAPAPKLTPETLLALSLLNLRLAGSLNDIHAFSLQDALHPPGPPAPDPTDASVSNLKQLGLAMLQYTQDYDEVLPPMQSATAAKTALYPYVKSETVFEQPSTHKLYPLNSSLSHRRLVSFAGLSKMVIYYEASADPDGLRAVLFLDGHVKRVTDADWQRLRAASHVPHPPQGVH